MDLAESALLAGLPQRPSTYSPFGAHPELAKVRQNEVFKQMVANKYISQTDADLANQLQWLLGDDCQRVDFNRARIDSGLDEWSKLFEVPYVRLRTIYRHDCSRNRCLNVALGEDGLTS